ncbi:MAG: hypothetical protein V3V18_14690 [Methylococcales bacterium]
MSLFDTTDNAATEAAKEVTAKEEARRIKRKFTIVMAGLFFVEIMPLPFTAFISLYTVRKRPDWFPDAVQSLYADIPAIENDKAKPVAVDSAVTRKKCSITIICMMLVDLGPIPLTIPVGLCIVRFRPKWFRNVVARLYADTDMVSSPGLVAKNRVRLYDD